jgi:hypothetical protein
MTTSPQQAPATVADSPRRWLRWVEQTGRPYALWFGPVSVGVAWIGLLVALLTPPQGPGIALCSFQAATGLPCPGCGLMRSLSCAARGLWFESWNYHPLGLSILALFVVTAAQSLAPKTLRNRLARRMDNRAALVGVLYLLFVATFIGFGAIRAINCALTFNAQPSIQRRI